MPEAAVKFVQCVGFRMEAIDGEIGAGHVILDCPRVERNGVWWDRDSQGKCEPSGREPPGLQR